MEYVGRRAAVAGAAIALLVLAGCGSQPQAELTSGRCEELARQTQYEAMAAVARAGHAADPQQLAAATDAPLDGASVGLPDFEAYAELSDARRATIDSALASTLIGVGSTITDDTILRSMDRNGPCEGFLEPSGE